MFDYINKKRIAFTSLLNICEETKMNALELGAQKIVVSLLQDIQKSHLEIARVVTLGKVDDKKLETFNQDILWCIKMLHPLFDVGHSLIPESMPVLHVIMDWCQTIYHEVYEKEIK